MFTDLASKFKHYLPGEEEFFAITGRTDAARTLYRDLMLSPNRHLVTCVTRPEEEVVATTLARRTELVPQRGGRWRSCAVGRGRGRTGANYNHNCTQDWERRLIVAARETLGSARILCAV